MYTTPFYSCLHRVPQQDVVEAAHVVELLENCRTTILKGMEPGSRPEARDETRTTIQELTDAERILALFGAEDFFAEELFQD